MRSLIIFLAALLVSPLASFGKSGEIIVVIDPGHGGSDPGHQAEYAGHADEKDLNLKIAKFLGGYIDKYLQNVRVVYTRTDDSFPSLDERVEKANSINADYFISIHCNGNENKNVRGTESHVHSWSSKKAVELARMIEKQFSTRAGRHSRGVKNKDDIKHSLQVLKFTQMTSVLVECGFVTNQNEANYLNTTNGQELIASAIFRAFRSFIQKQHPTISFVKSSSSASSTSESGSYTIQIMSSKTPVDVNGSHFKKLPSAVTRTELNTSNAYKYIYTVGNYATKEEADQALKVIKTKGFPDAYVVKR